MKLHLGCGTVYLAGYVNCDIHGMRSKKPIVGTSIENYYKDSDYSGSGFVDDTVDLTKTPWAFKKNGILADGSVNEIVMIWSIQCFTLQQATKIAEEARRVLILGGRFIVDFPDIPNIMRKTVYTRPETCMLALYGFDRKYERHLWGYTRGTWFNLLGKFWKTNFRKVVDHDLPAIGCEAIKL